MQADPGSRHAALARVIVSPHAQLRGLFRGLIEKVHDEGAEILLVTSTKPRVAYWQKELAGLKRIEFVLGDALYRVARAPVSDPDGVFRRARELESKIGLTINRLAVRDRHLGRGYAPGGLRHARSHTSERASYVQMVAAFVAEISYWEGLIEKFQPTLVLNCGEIASLLCDGLGIEFRRLAGSKTENFYQWAHNEYMENPLIRPAFDNTKEPTAAFALERPYKANEMFVKGFGDRVGMWPLLKRNAYMVAQYVYWHMRGYEKARGYYLRDSVLLPWQQRQAYLEMIGPGTVSLESLTEKRFAYFPLQTEPETALQGLSPEYPFQLEAIISLSRDLPAGMLLAVKDTPIALGRRPRDFYRQIRELKNVVMLDIRERGVDCINAADLVATISGTAGFEGAVAGKPVIVFGAHNPYDFLPHVWRVGRDGSLAEGVKKLLRSDFPAQQAKLDGARYVEAVKSISFRLSSLDTVDYDKSGSEDAAAAIDSLLASLTPRSIHIGAA